MSKTFRYAQERGGDWSKPMFHREATVNQGQGDVSPRSFFFEIWNHALKKKSQVSLIIPRSNVKLHMRRTKLQFEPIQTGKSSTVRSNVEKQFETRSIRLLQTDELGQVKRPT